MAQNITQLRRLVFRKKTTSGWTVFTMEPDDLGQDSILTVNVAPRKRSRASSKGSTESPISGTFDSLTASISFLADTWKIIGTALNRWSASTDGGQILFGSDEDVCDNSYLSVVAQGVCDDGSSADVEITRCQPSIDDDIEIGTSETPTITLNLNPIIYNASLHADDGYEAYTVRFGDYDTSASKHLNATTGEYDAKS